MANCTDYKVNTTIRDKEVLATTLKKEMNITVKL